MKVLIFFEALIICVLLTMLLADWIDNVNF